MILRLGPIKIKLGECFGGSGNNDNLRASGLDALDAGWLSGSITLYAF